MFIAMRLHIFLLKLRQERHIRFACAVSATYRFQRRKRTPLCLRSANLFQAPLPRTISNSASTRPVIRAESDGE